MSLNCAVEKKFRKTLFLNFDIIACKPGLLQREFFLVDKLYSRF